jgi:hypothetical protein
VGEWGDLEGCSCGVSIRVGVLGVSRGLEDGVCFECISFPISGFHSPLVVLDGRCHSPI